MLQGEHPRYSGILSPDVNRSSGRGIFHYIYEITQKFGGEGHKMAAGTFLPGPLENAKKLVLDEITKAFSCGRTAS